MSTWVPLLDVTLTGATSQVDLGAIPQNYSDIIVMITGGVTTGGNIRMRINGDKEINRYRDQKFAVRNLAGTKTVRVDRTTISSTQLDLTVGGNWVGWGPATTDNSVIFMTIPRYSDPSSIKAILTRNGSIQSASTNHETGIYTAEYVNTTLSAVKGLSFYPESSDTFRANTRFSLYGIGVGTAKALGGNIVTSDGTYWYHAFTSTGIFEPLEPITSQYLIVAGGGGGGGQQAGGGGAGGVRAFTGKALTAQKYTVTIGAGGRGGRGDSNVGITSGSNTTFNSDSVTGGGYGASNGSSGANGANGGSGGGGAINSSVRGTGNAGGYSPVEGKDGGAGGGGNGGSGGGGAGAAGQAKSGGNAGDGGAGTDTYNAINFSTWLTATNQGASTKVGGGGGGGNDSSAGRGFGGAGGGGNGAITDRPDGVIDQNGLPNTGGGAGGGPQMNGGGMGGNGGSGLVIIRYPV